MDTGRRRSSEKDSIKERDSHLEELFERVVEEQLNAANMISTLKNLVDTNTREVKAVSEQLNSINELLLSDKFGRDGLVSKIFDQEKRLSSLELFKEKLKQRDRILVIAIAVFWSVSVTLVGLIF